MPKQHTYSLQTKWTGNTSAGTSNYHAYELSYMITINGKSDLQCSSDAAFRGDKTKYTPEDFLVASLSGCHMLWYLHLCAEAGVVVTHYYDDATGIMLETEDGGGHFVEVTLHPTVVVAEIMMVAKALELHKKANQLCFIARSMNFPVYHKPTCSTQ